MLWSGAAGGTQPFETYESTVAADAPAAQYRFSDAAGSNTLADSAGGYTAANNGISLGGGGPFGGSASGAFGGEAYASVASSPLEGTSAFTAEAWVDWGGGTVYNQPIFAMGAGQSAYMFLTPASSRSGHPMMFEIFFNGVAYRVTAPKLVANVWDYVAVTEESGKARLYLDGKSVGEAAQGWSPALLGALSIDYIGKPVVSGEPLFKGSLSNVAFYTKALSQERIEAHYNKAEFPVNVTPPTITGTAKDGNTLTAKTATSNWTGIPTITFSYEWLRCNTAGEACQSIGATGAKYTAEHQDVGHTLKVLVTATNPAGTSTASSAPTATVAALPPSNTALPTISGTAQDGQKLTAGVGSWNGTPPLEYSYKWEVCSSTGGSCKAIAGATGETYRAISSQIGHTLRVVVTAANSAGSKSATSEATAVVQAGAPVNIALPVIGGLAAEGHSLSASTGTWLATPTSYSYQWEKCAIAGSNCSNISGAISASYPVGAGEVGVTLRVVVTASNSAGASQATSPVATTTRTCTDNWVGANNGVWQAASNWSTGTVPTASDIACIASGTVQVTAGANKTGVLQDAANLTVSGGSLELASGSAVSRVSGLSLANATIAGPGSIDVSGSLSLGCLRRLRWLRRYGPAGDGERRNKCRVWLRSDEPVRRARPDQRSAADLCLGHDLHVGSCSAR